MDRIDRIDFMLGILDKALVTVFVLILGVALGTVSFVAGANYAVQKHEDMYCPDDGVVSADISKGCKNGEGWDS